MNCSGVVSELGEEFSAETIAQNVEMLGSLPFHHTLIGAIEETKRTIIILERCKTRRIPNKMDFGKPSLNVA